MRPLSARAAMVILLLVYFFLATRDLTILPVIHSDEAWIASVSWQFAQTGVFGTPVFAGMSGMESRYYEFLPLYSLTQAALVRFAGLSLFSVRFLSVALGALLLTLTFRVGVRLTDGRVGIIAVLVLLFARMIAPDYQLASGLVFLDVSRLGRYDIYAAALGIAAFCLFVVPKKSTPYTFFATGILAGLAGLAHVNGLIWLPILFLAILWERAPYKLLPAFVAGFAAAWLPYIIYIVTDLPVFVSQMSVYRARVNFLDLAWYWNNLLDEPRRYRIFDVGIRRVWEHPGVWLVLFGGALGWLGLLSQIRTHTSRAQGVLLLSIPAIVLLLAFALAYKLSNYLILLEPLLALSVAWGIIRLADTSIVTLPRRWVRVALVLVLVYVCGEGIFRLSDYYARAAQTPSFESLALQLRRHVPPNARVLGDHTFWLALPDTDFRSMRVPFNITNPLYPQAQTAQAFFDTFAPQVILLDTESRLNLNYGERWGMNSALRAYISAHGLVKQTSVNFPNYGEIEIYSAVPPRVALGRALAP